MPYLYCMATATTTQEIEMTTTGYKTNYDTSIASITDLLVSLNYLICEEFILDVQSAMVAGNDGDFTRSVGKHGRTAAEILEVLDPCHD